MLQRDTHASIQKVEADFHERLDRIRGRQAELERARERALRRQAGASEARRANLSRLLAQLDQSQSQLGALIARCNQGLRLAAAKRVQLVNGVARREHLAQLQQPRPRPDSPANVRCVLRWTDDAPRQSALVSPSGRRVALIGGGEVIVVDLWTRRARRINTSGAFGIQFSAEERFLRFPNGHTWSTHVQRWHNIPTAWIPQHTPPEPLPLARLPHELDAPTVDPRWRLKTDRNRLCLVSTQTGWRLPLLDLPNARGISLQSNVLIVFESDRPRVSIYTVRPGPEMRWDAWAVRTHPDFHDVALAVLVEGLVETTRQLSAATDELEVLAHFALDGARALRLPGLEAQLLHAITTALAERCLTLLQADGDRKARADALDRVGKLAERIRAGEAASQAERRLTVLAEKAPQWADALLIETASGVLMGLSDGETMKLLTTTPGRKITVKMAVGSVEGPDAEEALAALSALQRDLDAQLAAIGEVDGQTTR